MLARTLVKALAPLLSSAVLFVSTEAQAQASEPTWRVDWHIEVPVLVLEGAVSLAWLLNDQLAAPHCAPKCDRKDVWAIDRWSAGRWHPDWALASDIAVATTIGGSFVALAVDEGFPAALVDGVVVVESIGMVGSIGILTMLATRRPRPFVYGDDAPLDERMNGQAALSFWSGHTANAFAAVTAVYVTARHRDPHASWPYVWLGGGYAAAAFVGAGRLLAGHHFLSDTLVAAAAGIAAGWLVPTLHQSDLRPALSLAPGGGTLGLSGAW